MKQNPLSFPFGRAPFCVLDTETTGLSAQMHEITEVSAIVVNERFEIVSEMSRLIRITSRVPWHITQLTGITDSMLSSKGVPLKQALEELHGMVNGMPAFAHNASFDRRFLNAAVERAGVDLKFTLDCSIPTFKRLLPTQRGYGLGVLAAALNVDGCGAHRALADCRILLGCLARAHGENITFRSE
jgi:DNA polymerase-3 subunit epsilon